MPANKLRRMACWWKTPPLTLRPASYVTAIITERGIARAPYAEALQELAQTAPALVGAKR